MKQKKRKNFPWITTVILLIVASVQIFPFYWLIVFSLKSNADIFGGNIIGIPLKPQWENYVTAMSNGNMGIYLFNSIKVTGISIVVSNILACMTAYALVRMKWKFSKLTIAFLSLGFMIPIQSTLLPLMIIQKKMGIIGTHMSLIMPYVAFALPFSVYILLGFVRQIPRELEEAVCIDGGGIYRLFFCIALPLLKPAIATISIFTYISCWNELMFAMTFISKNSLKTLTYGILLFQGEYTSQWGPMGAGLFVSTVPTIIMYLAFSEYFQKGIIAGAVKG